MAKSDNCHISGPLHALCAGQVLLLCLPSLLVSGHVQVTGIMVPLLKFYFHEEVRAAAVQAMPELLRSASEAAAKGCPGADQRYVKQMLDFIWGPIMDAMRAVRPTT